MLILVIIIFGQAFYFILNLSFRNQYYIFGQKEVVRTKYPLTLNYCVWTSILIIFSRGTVAKFAA